MPPVAPNPVGDLARMYRARIPTPTQTFGGQPRMLGIENPQGNTAGLRSLGRQAFSIVASPAATILDVIPGYEPESVGAVNLAQEGGASLQQLVGDVAAIPGVGEPNSSPTADAYRRAGGGLQGVLSAALPYVNLATTAAPFVGGAANRAASQLAKQRLAQELENVVVGKPLTLSDYLMSAARDKELGFNTEYNPRLFEDARMYYGATFPDIQETLRGRNVPLSMKERLGVDVAIKSMDDLFEQAPPLTRPLRVFRGVKDRGYYGNYGDFVKNLKVGDRFTEPGFVSTTVDPDMAAGFSRDGYVFQIEVPSKQRVVSSQAFNEDPMGGFSPEREITLPRGSQFEVTKREGNNVFVRLVPGQR